MQGRPSQLTGRVEEEKRMIQGLYSRKTAAQVILCRPLWRGGGNLSHSSPIINFVSGSDVSSFCRQFTQHPRTGLEYFRVTVLLKSVSLHFGLWLCAWAYLWELCSAPSDHFTIIEACRNIQLNSIKPQWKSPIGLHVLRIRRRHSDLCPCYPHVSC